MNTEKGLCASCLRCKDHLECCRHKRETQWRWGRTVVLSCQWYVGEDISHIPDATEKCPFCGGEPEQIIDEITAGHGPVTYVYCTGCGYSLGQEDASFESIKRVAEEWDAWARQWKADHPREITAREFMRAKERMCNLYRKEGTECKDCPRKNLRILCVKASEEEVDIVEQWVKEHPEEASE